MGNQLYNNRNNNREYDLIFHIENLMDIDIGWPIKFHNPLLKEFYQPERAENGIEKNPLKTNVKWDSQIVSIQGKHKAGKTFLLNLLGELDICNETKGLSLKMIDINGRNMVILETGGIEKSIVPMPTKECKMQIEEKKGTENLLRDISISSSDLNILVTEQFSHQDHSLLIKISNILIQKIKKENDIKKSKNKAYVKTRPEILIVHNLRNETYEDALVQWKSYVKEISKYQPVHVSSFNDNVKEPNNCNENSPEKMMAHKMETTEEIDGEEITFIHLFLCKNQEGGYQYNSLVRDEIKSWLTEGQPQKEIMINPLGYLSTMSEINLNNYVTGMEKMGMYYLSDQFSLFYMFVNNPHAFNSSYPNTSNTEMNLLKENLEKFHLDFEKEVTTHMSLLETKNILKWTVNQCEQLREWMLTSREKKINGIPFDFFPRLYNLKWEEYVENMWKRNLDYIILYAISQALKYRVVILTSNPTNPIFVFTPEKEKASKETMFFSFVRYDSEVYYSKLVCKEQLAKKHILDISDRESKIKKFSHIENFLTFRSNENSKEKKIFGGKSILKSNFVSSNLSSYFDFSQQFSVKYTTEINKKDESMRIVIDVPDSSNDFLEYDCTLLYEPKRFKLVVKGKRELEEEWVVSEGTRKFGEWTFNYEIPKQYTIEQPEVSYTDGVLIFTFKQGEVLSTAKKIIKKSK